MEQTRDDQAASDEETDSTSAQARQGVTRQTDDALRTRDATPASDEESLRTDARRFDDGSDGLPPGELRGPGGMRETVDVTDVAPDGTPVSSGGSTDPFGAAIGGSGISDAVQSEASVLGGDALGRSLDYDPLTPGTQDSRPGGQETTGDPSVDRAISAHDGSQIGMDVEIGPGTVVRPNPVQGEVMEFPMGPRVVQGEVMEFPISPPGGGGPPGAAKMENPDADTGDNVTNLERVTVMQGSQVQPSNNPDDPATGEVSTDNWIPPEDLVSRPAQEGEVEATTLTSAATLGSSPVTNPTDPVLGDDGILTGGSSSGGGSGGGDTIDSMTAMGTGAASSLGEGDANAGQKVDANNVSVDMATGQIVGTAAPALGNDLSGGWMVSSGGEGGDGDEGGGVQSFDAGTDAASAIGSADAGFGGVTPGAPGGLEGPPAVGEEPPPDDEG